ncbi:hypothetical protein L0668_10245 [Paraglaciecola aquimarina]|uniref:Uncharacterized protein n=1 Tax=Paraglaciecola algarum TaxID=3050085 RepID=A0ABS9D6I7_9ALTE|nr:ABC-three component system middle component 1 [Paraglaciecola sp. G1-23]MCF2948486.1 hypothetical protein [Paraglaciecola sp. G1-23]
MDKLFDNLMERIFLESNFSLIKSEYNVEDHDCSTFLYIGQKLQGDYFVYIHLPERLLPYVNSDIQIKITSLIKSNAENFKPISSQDVKISSSFDKNATLIIFTSHDDRVKNNVINQAISIEEDPYFFKKQVLILPEKELQIVSSCFAEHKNSYITYIQNLISDIERFNEFTGPNLFGLTDKGIEYSFIAKLYEKLPFLALLVSGSNQDVLQQKIDKKLTEEQLLECEKLLGLDVNNLDGWLSAVIGEETGD